MSKHILIAEDTLDLQAMFAFIFTKRGYVVTAVSSGAAALEHIARAGMPDLILLDLNIPVVSGIEVMREVRAQAGVQPQIIVLTGSAQAEHTPEISMADLFLVKPVSLVTLADLADRLVTSSSSSKQASAH